VEGGLIANFFDELGKEVALLLVKFDERGREGGVVAIS